MLRQPVPKQSVGYADANGGSVVRHERRRFEPRVEAVAVDLCLDPGKDLLPDVDAHFGPISALGPVEVWLGRREMTISGSDKNAENTGNFPDSTLSSAIFRVTAPRGG